MHELSIASSILDLAMKHTPPGAVLRAVRLRAGPMRGIEPQAMEWAWQANVADTPAQGSRIEVETLPWRLHCPDCGSDFVAEDIYGSCACGCKTPHPISGDELQVVSIEVDEKEAISRQLSVISQKGDDSSG